jgi:hypothetical protein
MSKFIKTLIVINGILIPLLVVVFIGFLVSNLVRNNNYRETETGVLTKNVVQKDSLLLAKQGLEYSSPRRIDGTENYFLPIAVKTYEEPQVLKNHVAKLSCMAASDDNSNYLNIIFLDKNYNVLHRLLNRKAAIVNVITANKEESVELDTSIHNLAFEIAFEDTNGDGQLNSQDEADVYISGIDGSNLTKVTTGLNIASVEFVQKNTKLLIEYYDLKKERKEYKELKFAIYNIGENKLTQQVGIAKEIQEVKTILNKK